MRILLTGEDTNSSVSIFEIVVPAGQKLAAPAHKNDAYEETLYGLQGVVTWTIDGRPVEVGPVRLCAFLEAPSIASTISAWKTPSRSPS